MPTEPDIGALAINTAAGAVGGGVAALSRPMSRREVFFCLVGGVGIGAFLPDAIMHYTGAPAVAARSIAFIGGISVCGIVPLLQAFTNRWLSHKTEGISPRKDKEGQS